MFRALGACAAVILMCLQLVAAPPAPLRFRDYVEIEPGRELYVDWIKAQPGKPTVVLLNGMTYSTRYWDDFTAVLQAKGIGVIRYDMYGMGKTLVKDAHRVFHERPYAAFEAMVYTALGLPQDMIDNLIKSPVMNAIKIEDQARDLEKLLDKLGQTGRVNLVGLSYGGAVGVEFAANNPNRVNNLVIQAPYTEPMAEQVQAIRNSIAWTRRTWPGNMYSDRALYDFWLRTIVFSQYPKVEPSVLDHPYKLEATFRLAQGATDWKALALVSRLPEGKLHLMIAGADQYIKTQVLEDFWIATPAKSKGSKVFVTGSEHKIPEAVPGFSANWVHEILTGNSVISEGRAFDADPKTGVVRYPGGELRISYSRKISVSLSPAEVVLPTQIMSDARSAPAAEALHATLQRIRISSFAAHSSVQ